MMKGDLPSQPSRHNKVMRSKPLQECCWDRQMQHRGNKESPETDPYVSEKSSYDNKCCWYKQLSMWEKSEVKFLPYTICQNQLQIDYRYNWGKQT